MENKKQNYLMGNSLKFSISMKKGMQDEIRKHTKKTGIYLSKVVEFALIKELENKELKKYVDIIKPTTFTVSMRSGLQDKIRAYAKEIGIPVSKVVEFALLKELKLRDPKF